MRILIIEDELFSGRRLERMLERFNHEVLTILVSIKSAVKWLNTNIHPDIIFMDIHLSDGLCFQIFEQTGVKSLIVFTTAYSEYSIKAFDYNSISYLLKPIKEEELIKAIEKASTFSKMVKELIALKNNLKTESLSGHKNEFVIKVGKKIKIIQSEEISCFFSSNNSTYLRKELSNYILNSSLNRLQCDLNTKSFFKVNRKVIINRDFIKEIKTYSNNRYKIVLNEFEDYEIIVSRERSKFFKKWLKD